MSGQKKSPVKFSDKFLKDFRDLPDDLVSPVKACLADLECVPIPQGRRAHSVTPRGQRPNIHTVDVLSNKSWKLSFLWKGPVIWVLRVCMHNEMDRDPGRTAAKLAIASEE